MNMFLSGPMRKIANMGRMGDTELAHVTPEEKKILKAMGGSGTMNPRTGMPEYFNLTNSINSAVNTIKNKVQNRDPSVLLDLGGAGGIGGIGGAAGPGGIGGALGPGGIGGIGGIYSALGLTDSGIDLGSISDLLNQGGGNSGDGGGSSSTGASDLMKALLFKRYQDDVLDKSYQAYTGTRFAGFNPDQKQAFTDTRTFAGSMPGGFQTAMDTAEGETTYQSGFTTAGQDQEGFQRELDARMNPFTQSVINQLQKDISEQQQIALGKNREQARAAGAFGGSRQGVAEALTSGRYGDAFARTAGQLRADQFNRAMAGVDQDRARQEQFRGKAAETRLGAGRDLLTGTQATDATTARRINALARSGNQQQALEQAQKDFAYQQFLEERDYDKMNILAGGGLLGSAPGDYREPPVYGRQGGLSGFFDFLFGSPTRIV